jgi:hypothetical protein
MALEGIDAFHGCAGDKIPAGSRVMNLMKMAQDLFDLIDSFI